MILKFQGKFVIYQHNFKHLIYYRKIDFEKADSENTKSVIFSLIFICISIEIFGCSYGILIWNLFKLEYYEF